MPLTEEEEEDLNLVYGNDKDNSRNGTNGTSVFPARTSLAGGNMIESMIKKQVVESLANPDSPLWSSTRNNNGAFDKSRKQEQLNGNYSNRVVKDVNAPVSDPFPNGIVNGNVGRKQIGTRYEHAYNDPLNEWLLPTSSCSSIDKTELNLLPVNPFELTKSEITTMTSGLRDLVSQAGHPVLASAAEYFFGEDSAGKKVRPVMVLLISHALNAHLYEFRNEEHQQNVLLNHDIYDQRKDLVDAQRRLAEISEMIHTASLFHDDVIDESDVRRGKPSANAVFGNKMAILAGDFLLARASICLARLRDVEVVETMSTIIEHLVRGEVMQTKSNIAIENYLKKNYFKTASLMANSCKAAAILGNYSNELVNSAYLYGKHVGIAFQLVDDVLDFEGTSDALGKPVCADLRAGLATAPVLFAAEEFPELNELIARKFRQDGDVEVAMRYISKSSGICRTKEMARAHAEHAIKSLLDIHQSEYRDALIHLAYKIVDRST